MTDSYVLEVVAVKDETADARSLSFAVPDGAGFVPRLFERLGGHGVAIRSVTVTRPSLDDVFLAHTGTTIRDAEAGPSMHPMAMRMRR